ncbi:hypothetical protein V1477_004915 [Vespula maculifrons]|uniref:Uncharacterized protein n=1 Tax=Vespula maculifrons TaxID=7453 RepID=A0ABD2CPB1_VESMC
MICISKRISMGLSVIVTFEKEKELKTTGIFNNCTYLRSRRLDERRPAAYIDYNATLEILTEKIKGHQIPSNIASRIKKEIYNVPQFESAATAILCSDLPMILIIYFRQFDIADEPKNDREVLGFTYRRWAQTNEPDCLRSARMASYMQAACSLAVKQNGNLILDLNISTVIPHQSPKCKFRLPQKRKV